MARMFCFALVFCSLPLASARSDEPAPSAVTMRLEPLHVGQDAPVVTAIATDPRGELIAVAGDDHAIRILSVGDWKLIKVLDLHVDWVRDLQFSPDGTLLASVAQDGKLLFWERGAQWRSVEGLGDGPALAAVRFSPRGDLVATVGFAPEVFLVGVNDARRPRLSCGCRDLRTLDFRHDGELLCTAGRSGDLHFYDAVTGSTLGDVQLHRRRIRALMFIGQTGHTLTVAEDGHVVVYDPAERKVVHDLTIPGSQLMSACLIGEEYAAVAGSDNTIHIIDLKHGEVVKQLPGHSGSVASLAYRDGRLYSGSFDTTLRVWSTAGVIEPARVAGAEAATVPDARTSRRP